MLLNRIYGKKNICPRKRFLLHEKYCNNNDSQDFTITRK